MVWLSSEKKSNLNSFFWGVYSEPRILFPLPVELGFLNMANSHLRFGVIRKETGLDDRECELKLHTTLR